MSYYRESILSVLANDGMMLKHLSPMLQDDKEIVLKAIDCDQEALQFASVRLRNDREIVLAALSWDPHTIVYASDELQRDMDIIREHPRIYEYLPCDVQSNEDVKKMVFELAPNMQYYDPDN